MDLSPYVENLRRELAVAAESAGDEARELAERLTAPLESAVRLMLLDALSGAAEEITREMAPGSVDLRLRGREPSFVVTVPPSDDMDDVIVASPAPTPAPVGHEGEEGATARISLRLPEQLKGRAEEAAGQAGLSVNAWLVRAVAAALEPADTARRSERTVARGGQRFTGWVH